jgi:hypothetical protein
MTRWIILNRHLVHAGWFAMGATGLLVMSVINVLLLKRLFDSDFKSSSKSSVSRRRLAEPTAQLGNGKSASNGNGASNGHRVNSNGNAVHKRVE